MLDRNNEDHHYEFIHSASIPSTDSLICTGAEADKSFERDGVSYKFYSNFESQSPDYDFFSDEQKANIGNQVQNKKALITQAMLADVAFMFEDKPATDIYGRPMPNDFAVYRREDDAQAPRLLLKVNEIHHALSEEHSTSAFPLPSIDGDPFTLAPHEARELLVTAAEEIGYELPDHYLAAG